MYRKYVLPQHFTLVSVRVILIASMLWSIGLSRPFPLQLHVFPRRLYSAWSTYRTVRDDTVYSYSHRNVLCCRGREDGKCVNAVHHVFMCANTCSANQDRYSMRFLKQEHGVSVSVRRVILHLQTFRRDRITMDKIVCVCGDLHPVQTFKPISVGRAAIMVAISLYRFAPLCACPWWQLLH